MSFKNRALELFRYQSFHNEVYREFLSILKTDIDKVGELSDIPFLPIDFFKTHMVKTDEWDTEIAFESSGTTGQSPSKHYVKDINSYLNNTKVIFKEVYGNIEDYCFLALLPGYLERPNSSLIAMVDAFIKESSDSDSGFYLNNMDELNEMIHKKIGEKKKTMLWGVSYALLDLCESFTYPSNDLIIMETGGMKGKRKEMVKAEMYSILEQSLNTLSIHSEYGMTELLSQSYSKGKGEFQIPKQMDFIIRPIDDPLGMPLINKQGRMDIIDLANEHSCAFIGSSDIGIRLDKNTIRVLGRIDNSDIRGCNLLYQ